jgi:hypothetical protein
MHGYNCSVYQTPDYYQRIVDKGEDMEVAVLSCILQLAIN